jgi:hypothetical protein
MREREIEKANEGKRGRRERERMTKGGSEREKAK